MNHCLLDTDIFSEIAKGVNLVVLKQSDSYFARHGTFTLSAPTVFEICGGLVRRGRVLQLRNFEEQLETLEVLPLTLASARLAGEIQGRLLQAGRPIGAYDPLIAAIALEHDLDLVTGNEAHFGFIAGLGYPLRVTNWRSPVP